MRKILLIILILITCKAFSKEKIYSSSKNNFVVLIDSCENVALSFKLNRLYDLYELNHYIYKIDTCYQNVSDSSIYKGKFSAFKLGKKYSILDYEEMQGIEVSLLSNENYLKKEINSAYWWMKFLKGTDTINHHYLLGNYSFRNGDKFWINFTNKTSDFKVFKTFTDSLIQRVFDSVSISQFKLNQIAINIIQNSKNITFQDCKSKILLLAKSSNQNWGFLKSSIDSIAYNNPKLFYELVDSLPQLKEQFYYSLSKKSTKKVLQSYSNKISKKEFRKFRRANTLAATVYISIVVLEIGLITFGVYKLIDH